jgi:hypothetical protein
METRIKIVLILNLLNESPLGTAPLEQDNIKGQSTHIKAADNSIG